MEDGEVGVVWIDHGVGKSGSEGEEKVWGLREYRALLLKKMS